MKVGIHYEPLHNISKRLKRYEQILNFNNIEVVYISSSTPDFFKIIKDLDAIIWHVGLADASKQPYYNIVPVIENDLKIPCFPSSKPAWSFDSKIRQIHQMEANGFPIVKSWVVYEKKAALSLTDTMEFPLIFKLSSGAGSLNVIKVNSKKELANYINKMFNNGFTTNYLSKSLGKTFKNSLLTKAVVIKNKILGRKNDYRDLIKDWSKQSNYLLLQKFMVNNQFDTRVTTIGNRAFAFRRFNRQGDFRSSGSGLIDHDHNQIDIRCVKKAMEISKHFGFETMAYDFLFDEEKQPVICEYSYGYNDESMLKCNGYWDENLSFIEGNYWPQYFHLRDLLNMPNLKQIDL